MEETIRFLCSNCNRIVLEVVGVVVFECEHDMEILCKECMPKAIDQINPDMYLDAINTAKVNIAFENLIDESGIDIS